MYQNWALKLTVLKYNTFFFGTWKHTKNSYGPYVKRGFEVHLYKRKTTLSQPGVKSISNMVLPEGRDEKYDSPKPGCQM